MIKNDIEERHRLQPQAGVVLFYSWFVFCYYPLIIDFMSNSQTIFYHQTNCLWSLLCINSLCICREVPNKSLVTFVWCLLSIVKIKSEDRLSVLSCVNSWCWCLLSEASYFFSFLRLNALAITLFLNSNSTHFSPAVMMVVVSQFNVPSQLLESFWRLQVRMYFQESTRMLHEKKKKKHKKCKGFFSVYFFVVLNYFKHRNVKLRWKAKKYKEWSREILQRSFGDVWGSSPNTKDM